MAITDIFKNLQDLQTILVEKYDLENKVENAPKDLLVQEAALARSQKELKEIDAECSAVKEEVLKLKLELESAVKSIEEGEKGMDNITTHREYEALEKQINEAKAKEEELRQNLQIKEKKFAELNEIFDNKVQNIQFQESELNASKETVDKNIAGYNEKLAVLKAEEEKITPNLDQEILFKFERIIQRNSQGVVSVKNGVCSGCHMILPAQFANIVHTGENINFCPYCSRILYYEEVADDEQIDASFNFNSAGSLADFDDDDDEDYYNEEDEDFEKDYDEESDDYDRMDDDEINDDMDEDLDDENPDEEDEEE